MKTTDNFFVEVKQPNGEYQQFGPFVATKQAAQKLLMSQRNIARICEFVTMAKPNLKRARAVKA